jgi:hypothetical protein
MTKLKGLITALALTLGDPEKSVSVHAMHLRKAKLLSSTGRGLHSARMGPSDATNLLLACLHAGKAKDSVSVVARLREALISDSARIAGHLVPLEEVGLPSADAIRTLPEHHTLGSALDALFEEWCSTGEVKNQITGEPFSIHLDLTTTAAGWSASLFFRAQHADWEIIYDQRRAERDAIEPTRGHKETTVRVPNVSLSAIAGCIGDERQVNTEPRA